MAASGPSRLLLDLPAEQFPFLLHLAPPTVRPTDSLDTVVSTLALNPTARMVFVVDGEDRLLGMISEHRLDADLVKLMLPQQLWASMGELDPRQLLLIAKGKSQTAADLMTRCSAVLPTTKLRDILVEMIRDNQSVRPLTDDQHRLLGFLTMFEILAELLHPSRA